MLPNDAHKSSSPIYIKMQEKHIIGACMNSILQYHPLIMSFSQIIRLRKTIFCILFRKMLNTKIYILCIVNVAAYIVEPTESDVKQKEKKHKS